MKNKKGRFKLDPFEPLHLEQTPCFTSFRSCLNLGGLRKKLELPIMAIKAQFFPSPLFLFPSFFASYSSPCFFFFILGLQLRVATPHFFLLLFVASSCNFNK